jgi:uncharacterized protein (TIGR02646 family)
MRTGIAVPMLAEGGLGHRRGRQNERDREQNPVAKISFPDFWNETDVRGALYAMQGTTCAYCGCNLPANDRGDVEHFRPKTEVYGDPTHGGYWWLAYSFQNYLLSCSLCNRVRKQTRFPLRPRGTRTTYITRRNLSREARVLLDPSLDPIEEWLDVDWQNLLCPIQPIEGLCGAALRQVEGTLKLFKINVNPKLVKQRMRVRDHVLEALNNGRENQLSKMASRYSQHSLVVKRLLEDVAPRTLPTPEQELRWLIEDILEILDLTLDLDQTNPGEIQQREIDELLWSLAVLWRAPPAGRSADVENILNAAGIINDIQIFYDALG